MPKSSTTHIAKFVWASHGPDSSLTLGQYSSTEGGPAMFCQSSWYTIYKYTHTVHTYTHTLLILIR